MFEADQRFYEILFSACTAVEEERWKFEFGAYTTWASQKHEETDESFVSPYSFLFLEIRESAAILDDPRVVTRGHRLQRSATIIPRAHMVPVIIKNTHVLQRGGQTESPKVAFASLSRSHSLFTTNQVPILAPDRAYRTRMEQAMSDVWTRGTLPYPAMTANRSGQFFRASANSMMRRLSKASMASTSTRRSVSQTSITELGFDGVFDDPFIERPTTANIELPMEGSIGGSTAVLQSDDGTEPSDRPRVSFSLEDIRKTGGMVDTNRKSSTDSPEGSEDSTIIAGTDGRHVKDMVKKPKTLSKAFSMKRLRARFS